MKVQRIVVNIACQDLEAAQLFYGNLFGLELAMDHGWIQTYTAPAKMQVQISAASEGGSGTEVPDLSIEVDDLEQALARAGELHIPVVYGPADEPWGVRRFYIRDPFGKLINVLQHI